MDDVTPKVASALNAEPSLEAPIPTGYVLIQKVRQPDGINAHVGQTAIGHVHTVTLAKGDELTRSGEFAPWRPEDAAALESFRGDRADGGAQRLITGTFRAVRNGH